MFYLKTNLGKQYICFKDSNDIEWGVPKDENNKDYREYLKWVAEGNTAEEIE